MAYNYTLLVVFKEKSRDVLYDGISFYRGNLIDRIKVSRHQIAICFSRSGKIDIENYLYSPQSPVRYQLYRAACFYLAVMGTLPDVKQIRIALNNETIALDKDKLTKNWTNCNIARTMPAETAAICFGENGKSCYAAITYFLKAQLDPFPRDRFRAAWSGLNALYSQYHIGGNEQEKLKALSQLIRQQKPKLSVAYVKTLSDDFWRHLKWGLMFSDGNLSRDALIKKIQNNNYADLTIYKYLLACYRNLLKKSNDVDCSEMLSNLETRINRKRDNYPEQLSFLATEYCYLLRNRSFHAAEPYPVFDLFDDSKASVEDQLVELLLLLMRELIPIIYQLCS